MTRLVRTHPLKQPTVLLLSFMYQIAWAVAAEGDQNAGNGGKQSESKEGASEGGLQETISNKWQKWSTGEKFAIVGIPLIGLAALAAIGYRVHERKKERGYPYSP